MKCDPENGRADIMDIGGGGVPAQDYELLLSHGGSAAVGPGTVIPNGAKAILTERNKRLGH